MSSSSPIHRDVGPMALMYTGLGSIIGSGWLFGAWNAARLAGPGAIWAWVLGAAIIMTIALTYAELGAMFPESGGMVRYGHYSHGSLVGFIAGWANWIAIVSVIPIEALNPKHPNKVCKLLKSIYGLKQASRSWNLRFNEKIKEFGFSQNQDEPCVYMKTSENKVVFLILYVDDILLIGNHIPTLQDTKSWLGKCFAMKDLGEATYILGIRIYRDRSKRLIGLSQSTYIDQILRRFSMQNSKRGALPMQKGTILSKSQSPVTPDEIRRMGRIPYASAIGSIMYAMICTRPDVSLALSLTSRHQQNPGEEHWTAVKNILKYLRRTK